MGNFTHMLLTAAAVLAAIGVAFATEPSFGTFTDTRDGQTYKTVKIGKQTWMAQNLNYKADSSWCYEDKVDNCKKYGRLYAWNAAKKACPTGYHLPPSEEWDSLGRAVGSKKQRGVHGYISWYVACKKLKTKSGWYDYSSEWAWNGVENGNGTDDYGFSALPGGYYSTTKGELNVLGSYGYWWTATEHILDNSAFCKKIYHAYDYVNGYFTDKGLGYSVRCVADRP